MTNRTNRLASLDILRGFDLFLLLFLQPVLVEIHSVWSSPWFDSVMYQFNHEVWEGFRCWDMVMPLFLFMVGASMPFSFAHYRTEPGSRKPLYKRIARRFGLLFLFGMIVQGNLLGLDVDRLYIYNNTLQAIAVGYLIAAVILLNCSVVWQVIWTVLLMVVYSVPMALFGDWSVDGNFAYAVDKLIIGNFRGDVTYTWIWSSLTFGATVMFGALAGNLMKNGRQLPRKRIAAILMISGITLTALAMALSAIEPIIKHLWTSSMCMFAAGISIMLMAVFYWWIDVRGNSFGLNWLKIYGMNPITAYVIGEVINFRSIVASVSYGLQPYLGPWYAVWLTFGNFLILFFILRAMYKHKVFLKL